MTIHLYITSVEAGSGDLAVLNGGVGRTGERSVEKEVVLVVWPRQETGGGPARRRDLRGHRSERTVTVTGRAGDPSLPATVEHSDLAVQTLQSLCVCVERWKRKMSIYML